MKSQIFKQKLKTKDYIFIAIATISIITIGIRIYSQYGCNFQTNILMAGIFLVSLPLLFLAYKDFKTFEVDHYISLIFIIIFSLLNILLFLIKGNEYQISLSPNWIYSPYQNLLGALTLGSIFQLLVIVSKEKGLGQGDVRIAILCGLLLGINNLLVWLYITIFTALGYGVVVGIQRKKFKGTKIPFVPFMVLGIIGTIIYLV